MKYIENDYNPSVYEFGQNQSYFIAEMSLDRYFVIIQFI